MTDLPSRLTQMRQGEVVRLPDGTAVKRHATDDGRNVWSVGRPRTYAPGELSYGEAHRTADAAASHAHEASAASTDPASLGGPVRIARWTPIAVHGTEHRLARIEPDGSPVVRNARTGAEARASWASITRPALSEAAEVGKPGTNWTQVTPEHRKKINPIVNHYKKMAHPFTACVRDNTKRFGPERAKKVCAVVKDMGERTTKWRKGGRKTSEALLEEELACLLLASGLLHGLTDADYEAWAGALGTGGDAEWEPGLLSV